MTNKISTININKFKLINIKKINLFNFNRYNNKENILLHFVIIQMIM